MKSSVAAVLLILSHEDLRLTKYIDLAGHWTIAWGHKLLPGEVFNKVLTRIQANDLFEKDFAKAEHGVAYALAGAASKLNPNQFGALTCLTYNIGNEAFLGSSIVDFIKADKLNVVPDIMRQWNKYTDKKTGKKLISQELVTRRDEEVSLFLREWNPLDIPAV
jgi:lysozyme